MAARIPGETVPVRAGAAFSVRAFVAPLEPSGSIDARVVSLAEEDPLSLGARTHARVQKRLLRGGSPAPERGAGAGRAGPSRLQLPGAGTHRPAAGPGPANGGGDQDRLPPRGHAPGPGAGPGASLRPAGPDVRLDALAEDGAAPRCRLRVISLLDEAEALLDLPFDPDGSGRWVQARLEAHHEAFLRARARAAERRRLGAGLALPFADAAPGPGRAGGPGGAGPGRRPAPAAPGPHRSGQDRGHPLPGPGPGPGPGPAGVLLHPPQQPARGGRGLRPPDAGPGPPGALRDPPGQGEGLPPEGSGLPPRSLPPGRPLLRSPEGLGRPGAPGGPGLRRRRRPGPGGRPAPALPVRAGPGRGAPGGRGDRRLQLRVLPQRHPGAALRRGPRTAPGGSCWWTRRTTSRPGPPNGSPRPWT